MDMQQKIQQLARIFYSPLDDEDRFFTSVMLLTALTPFGVSDVLNLKREPLRTTEDNRTTIKWNSVGSSALQTVPPALVPAVSRAVAQLQQISEEARACAAFALKHPGGYRRHLPCIVPQDKPDTEALTDRELLSVLQADRKRLTLSQLKNIKWIKALADQTGDQISYSTLGWHAYATYRGAYWPYTDHSKKLRFDNALCLLREHEFHADFAIRRYSWVRPTADMINNKFKQKHGGGTANTLWKKHGITAADGSPLNLLSGELRKYYQQYPDDFCDIIQERAAQASS